jgi:hypothetical protein
MMTQPDSPDPAGVDPDEAGPRAPEGEGGAAGGPGAPRVGLLRAAALDSLRRQRPDVRVVAAAASKRAAIQACYRAVRAPAYAAANLDALADVLGDLGWLPDGPVALAWLGFDGLPDPVREPLISVLVDVTAQSALSRHPLTVYLVDQTRSPGRDSAG